MVRFIIWAVTLLAVAIVLTSLIVWLAPLLAALVILWVTLKVLAPKRNLEGPTKAVDISIRPVDTD